jgi:hypothetical protein
MTFQTRAFSRPGGNQEWPILDGFTTYTGCPGHKAHNFSLDWGTLPLHEPSIHSLIGHRLATSPRKIHQQIAPIIAPGLDSGSSSLLRLETNIFNHQPVLENDQQNSHPQIAPDPSPSEVLAMTLRRFMAITQQVALHTLKNPTDGLRSQHGNSRPPAF